MPAANCSLPSQCRHLQGRAGSHGHWPRTSERVGTMGTSRPPARAGLGARRLRPEKGGAWPGDTQQLGRSLPQGRLSSAHPGFRSPGQPSDGLPPAGHWVSRATGTTPTVRWGTHPPWAPPAHSPLPAPRSLRTPPALHETPAHLEVQAPACPGCTPHCHRELPHTTALTGWGRRCVVPPLRPCLCYRNAGPGD